jgi:hypothetical protein
MELMLNSVKQLEGSRFIIPYLLCAKFSTRQSGRPPVQSQDGFQYSVKLLIEMHYGKRLSPLNTQILTDFELLNLPFRIAGLDL